MVWKRIIKGPIGKQTSKTGSVWKGKETSPVRNIGTSAGRLWESASTTTTTTTEPTTSTTTVG